MSETKPEAKTGDGTGGDAKTGDPKTSAAAGSSTPKPKADESLLSKMTQVEVDAMLEGRLERQKTKLEKAHAAEIKARNDSDLEAGAKWQELAESRQIDIGKLQGQVEANKTEIDKVKRYEAALEGYVEKLKEGVPEEIMALLKDQDAAAQLEWLTDNAGTFVVEGDDGTNGEIKKKGGIPPTPKPSDSTKLGEQERREKAYRIKRF